MSPRRASLPPPLPPLRVCPDTTLAFARDVPGQTLAAPSRSRRGQKYQNKTACSTRNPFPAPSPASRPSIHVPSLSLGTCPAGLLAAPSLSRRGHKYNKQTVKTFNTCATLVPCPTPSPARARPFTSLRFAPGRARPDARCPLPLPAGAFKHINSYLSTQLLCVRPPPPCKRFFFLCSVIHLVPCLATLRHGPRRAPSQRFCGFRIP